VKNNQESLGPLTLRPVPFREALRGLLKVKPEPKELKQRLENQRGSSLAGRSDRF
jgi:hypothetical protein